MRNGGSLEIAKTACDVAEMPRAIAAWQARVDVKLDGLASARAHFIRNEAAEGTFAGMGLFQGIHRGFWGMRTATPGRLFTKG